MSYSSKTRVHLDGYVTGDGGEATCTVQALKVSMPGQVPAYTQFSVIAISKVLPDGLYTIKTIGGAHWVRHTGGNWLAA